MWDVRPGRTGLHRGGLPVKTPIRAGYSSGEWARPLSDRPPLLLRLDRPCDEAESECFPACATAMSSRLAVLALIIAGVPVASAQQD